MDDDLIDLLQAHEVTLVFATRALAEDAVLVFIKHGFWAEVKPRLTGEFNVEAGKSRPK